MSKDPVVGCAYPVPDGESLSWRRDKDSERGAGSAAVLSTQSTEVPVAQAVLRRA